MKKIRLKDVLFWLGLGAVWALMGWAFYEFVVLPTHPTLQGATDPLKFQVEGRDVELLSPLMLALILVVPSLWIVRRYTLSDLPQIQQHFGALLRALLIAALALGLSRVVFTTFESHVTTVFVVDTSASMPDQTLIEARTFIQQTYEQLKDGDDVRIVTFAKAPRVVEIPPGAQQIPPLDRPALEDDRLGSNIQEAMRLAYGLFPQDHIKRIVLISDGNQTEGDLLGETYNARDYGIKVFARNFAFEARPEVLVKGFILPEEEVKVGGPFNLGVEVFSTKATEASFQLMQNDFKDGEQTVSLAPGLNTVEFKTEVYEQGTRRYALTMTLPGGGAGVDTFKPNNSYTELIEVQGKPKVLYVEGEAGKQHYLMRALDQEKFDVEYRNPFGLPSNLEGYENFDALILSDVPAYYVSHGKMKAIDDFVQRKGGAFVMAGGENSFGPGGYFKTHMEQIMPVTFEGEKSRDTPAMALMLVIDRSGSMKGQKLELAKEAAKASVDVLQRNDKVGVIVFDDGYQEVVPLQSATNRIRIAGAIARIQPGGGTSIAPALQQAFNALVTTRAALKHIILLSDGEAPQDNIFTEILPAMEIERITVSTVAVGRGADTSLSQRIAKSGGGRYYFTADPTTIPKIFTKETSTVSRSQLVEEPFQPKLVKPVRAMSGIDFSTGPVLLGYVSTKGKPEAEVILTSRYGEPILARWRRGLGKAIAFTSDVKNRWGIEWIKWQKFPKFWAQLLRDSMYTDSQTVFPVSLSIDRGQGRILIDAVSEEDRFINRIDSQVALKTPKGDKIEMKLDQTAPGRYEGAFDLTDYGSYVVQITHFDEAGEKLAISRGTLTWPYPDEYLTLTPNEKLINKTVDIGRGALNPTPARLFDPEGESVKYKSELWPYFLFIALAIFVLDIMLRRLRLYGKTAIPWERVAGRG